VNIFRLKIRQSCSVFWSKTSQKLHKKALILKAKIPLKLSQSEGVKHNHKRNKKALENSDKNPEKMLAIFLSA
jgi:hypothetical protein